MADAAPPKEEKKTKPKKDKKKAGEGRQFLIKDPSLRPQGVSLHFIYILLLLFVLPSRDDGPGWCTVQKGLACIRVTLWTLHDTPHGLTHFLTSFRFSCTVFADSLTDPSSSNRPPPL